jgi:hypothetical protein
MRSSLALPFVAPIPTGHRIQLIHAQRWQSPLFGGAPSWVAVADPLVVDRETGVVYAGWELGRVVVPEPLGFEPNSGCQVVRVVEARVTSCVVTTDGGDNATVSTKLTFEIDPEGYRQ